MHTFNIIIILILFLLIIYVIFNQITQLFNNNIDSQINNILQNTICEKKSTKIKENFIVDDANKIAEYEDIKNTKDNDTNNNVDIKDIENEQNIITAQDFGWRPPFRIVSCANSSINDKFKTGPKRILPYSISCGFPDGMSAQNFYKTYYMAQPIRLENYTIRGYNYANYNDNVHPTKIETRILSQNTKGMPANENINTNLPVGYNYVFHNTPAMRMP